MINLFRNAGTSGRRPWRRRVSNQLAAFAAIMLFASTQVSSTLPNGGDGNPQASVSAAEQSADLNSAVVDMERGDASGVFEPSSVAARQKKNIRFKLNLFRLRR